MLRLILVYLVFVCSNFGFSQNNSSIDFIIKNLGINVDGHFNTFTINTEFDADNQLTEILSKIEVASIETGIDSRDEHLLKEDYFHQEKHEYITLQSTSIKKESTTEYLISANLTIKGKTKVISIPVKVQKTDSGRTKITSYFEINRSDFDVGGGSFVMSKTVKINVTHYHEQ
ncbi:YceI family protein [Winogradskyella algicola]|uniref:YceI family protein n=1 Tax=Winogradskyella algicola TaxID=2575815 RepID=UPI0011096CEC|nr:YceI family protein [Winogradskyella algicola]